MTNLIQRLGNSKFGKAAKKFGLTAAFIASPLIYSNAQNIDFTETGSQGSAQRYPAIIEHGTVYAYKEVKESKDNPLGIEKYPADKMKGTTPTVVYSPYEIEGNKIILKANGKLGKEPKDATPKYDAKGLDKQGDKLEIITQDFSNLFKTLVIKGSDGENDTIYYPHYPGQNGEKQNSVWIYKDDIKNIGVTDDGKNYYISADEIYGWKKNEDKTTAPVNDVLDAKYPTQYELSDPTTGEVKSIITEKGKEEPSYQPIRDSKKKRTRTGNGPNVIIEPGLEGAIANYNNFDRNNANAILYLGIGDNEGNYHIGPMAWWNFTGGKELSINKSNSSNTEQISADTSVINPDYGITRVRNSEVSTNTNKTEKTINKYLWGAGFKADFQIFKGLEASIAAGFAEKKVQKTTTENKTETGYDIVKVDRNGTVLFSDTLTNTANHTSTKKEGYVIPIQSFAIPFVDAELRFFPTKNLNIFVGGRYMDGDLYTRFGLGIPINNKQK